MLLVRMGLVLWQFVWEINRATSEFRRIDLVKWEEYAASLGPDDKEGTWSSLHELVGN